MRAPRRRHHRCDPAGRRGDDDVLTADRGPLPDGFRLALDPATRELDEGTVLSGGSPLRLLRLTPAGHRLVGRLRDGAPVPAGAGAQRLARRLLDSGMAHPLPGAAPFTADDVTVVVPTHDRPGSLARTLAALGPVGSVIVVDDGSADADGTAAVAAEHTAALVRHDRTLGPAVARDTGAAMAATPVLAFVDAECVPEPGWLEPLLAHLADPSVAAVAPRVVATAAPPGGAVGRVGRAEGPGPLRRRVRRSLAAYDDVRSPLDLGDRPGPARPRSWVPYVPTAVLVVRRAAFDDVGGFDDALRYGEDVDLTWRLARAGWTVRYEPSVTATHPVRPDLGAWLAQRVAYGSSAAPLATRHGRAVAPLAVSAWSALAWVLLGLGFRKTALAVAAGTTAALVPRLRVLDRPNAEALRLAGLGHLHAGRAVADALRRPWWPFAAVAAVCSRRARRGVALAAMVPPLAEWARRRPRLDPVTFTGLHLLDDAAYGAGVWLGCWRERSATALVPDLASWPGRRAPVEQ